MDWISVCVGLRGIVSCDGGCEISNTCIGFDGIGLSEWRHVWNYVYDVRSYFCRLVQRWTWWIKWWFWVCLCVCVFVCVCEMNIDVAYWSYLCSGREVQEEIVAEADVVAEADDIDSIHCPKKKIGQWMACLRHRWMGLIGQKVVLVLHMLMLVTQNVILLALWHSNSPGVMFKLIGCDREFCEIGDGSDGTSLSTFPVCTYTNENWYTDTGRINMKWLTFFHCWHWRLNSQFIVLFLACVHMVEVDVRMFSV